MLKELLLLPFDHRSSLSRDILGLTEPPSPGAQKSAAKQIIALKQIIFEGFLAARKNQRNWRARQGLGILVDEKYGDKILRQAKKTGIVICLPAEKSGREELAFEYGAFFGAHLKKYQPNFVKVLVRYHPANYDLNRRQLKKLTLLSRFCQKYHFPLMLELLVPATAFDLKKCGTRKKYDQTLRLTRTLEAIRQIRSAVKVDLWKLEGFSQTRAWQEISALTGPAKIIVLGRGEEEKQVKIWLAAAKKCPAVIGFAIGRTIFLSPLKKFVAGQISRHAAVRQIAANFEKFIKFWRATKNATKIS